MPSSRWSWSSLVVADPDGAPQKALYYWAFVAKSGSGVH
jgi:hypothetical protein